MLNLKINKSNISMFNEFAEKLRHSVNALGGGYNAHLHLDRAGTLDSVSALTESNSWSSRLERKHSLIELIHQTDHYCDESLIERALHYTGLIAKCGSSVAETFVDVTADGVGLRAAKQFAKARESLRDGIALRLGAYNPLGFKKKDTKSVELLKQALDFCDFIGALPERDDISKYPDHIGFEESSILHYELAIENDCDLHVHVDQRNDPFQCETERFLDAIEPLYEIPADGYPPKVWLVHFISPSRYDDERFKNLKRRLASLNIGIICCPSAALSMRQLRNRVSPTSNSIARVLDLCSSGVHVRIGCDNIADVASPAGTPDLIEELVNLSNAERFYDIEILSTIGAGKKLSDHQRQQVISHLEADQAAIDEMASEL